MKVAITGSRGFIGGHLKTRLEKEGHEIVEWDLKQNPPKCIKDFDINDISYEKPNAKYYIDDKAIRFFNWEMTMGVIKSA